MPTVTFFYSKKQTDSEKINRVQKICQNYGFSFFLSKIDGDEYLEERYAKSSPVVVVESLRINSPFTDTEVEAALVSVRNSLPSTQNERNKPGTITLNNHDKFSLWFAKSYVWVINAILLIFIVGAFTPPLLMLSEKPNSARFFYKFYSVLCHQLFFRSFTLGGAQFFYPRDLAGFENMMSFETATEMNADDLEFARQFLGNEKLGYKLGLCQRDIAIYLAMALFGIGFQFSKRKTKPIKWYVWFAIALIPIGLDGASQLPGLAVGWPDWLPIRESTPLLRVITGAMFGFGTAWFMFPQMEEGMKATRQHLETKKRLIKKLEEGHDL